MPSNYDFGVKMILIFSFALLGVSCSTSSPPLDKEIYGKVTLNNQWQEITFKEPLTPERQISELVIWLAEEKNYCADFPSGKIKTSDGSLMIPEGQIIAQDGTVYELHSVGLSNTGVTLGGYVPNKTLSIPKDKTYTKVRLRCSQPLVCRQIVWRNYNPWDYK
ncbi:MAG: hypothetical protein AB1757_27275 [Acidobacteriota bacterium]